MMHDARERNSHYYDYKKTISSMTALPSRRAQSFAYVITDSLTYRWGDLFSCFMTVSGKASSHKRLRAISSGPHTLVGCWWNQRVTRWLCNSCSVCVINSHYRGTAKHSCGYCLHFWTSVGFISSLAFGSGCNTSLLRIMYIYTSNNPKQQCLVLFTSVEMPVRAG